MSIMISVTGGGTPLTAQLKRLAFPFLSAGWWGGEDKDYCAKFSHSLLTQNIMKRWCD